MQHGATLNVVLLSHFVIIHLLPSKDQPAQYHAIQQSNASTSPEDVVPCPANSHELGLDIPHVLHT